MIRITEHNLATIDEWHDVFDKDLDITRMIRHGIRYNPEDTRRSTEGRVCLPRYVSPEQEEDRRRAAKDRIDALHAEVRRYNASQEKAKAHSMAISEDQRMKKRVWEEMLTMTDRLPRVSLLQLREWFEEEYDEVSQ